MINKYLGLFVMAISSLTTSFAYADAAINIDVTETMAHPSDSFWINNAKHWGYQFDVRNNENHDKVIKFTLSVDPQSPYGASIQCWHGTDPIQEFVVMPGQTSSDCTTNDAVRVVPLNDDVGYKAFGHYSISYIQ